MTFSRRSFLKFLGLGAAAAVLPALPAEPPRTRFLLSGDGTHGSIIRLAKPVLLPARQRFVGILEMRHQPIYDTITRT